MKMYDNVLEKVKLYEEKRGIVYATTDGRLYKGLKGLYVLAFVYTMVMNFFFIMGNVLSETRFENFKNSVYTVGALSLVLIVALVALRFKKHIVANAAAFVLNAFGSAALVLTFAKLLEDVLGYKASFYWRHLVPLCILVFLSLCLTIIAVRAILKTQKSYKKVVENLYLSHQTAAENTGLSDEEWDEVLKNI